MLFDSRRCEENYAVSVYFHEFWNTISNVFIFGPCLIAMYKLLRHPSSEVELRYLLSLLGLGIVGFGSWMFHQTGLWEMQLLGKSRAWHFYTFWFS